MLSIMLIPGSYWKTLCGLRFCQTCQSLALWPFLSHLVSPCFGVQRQTGIDPGCSYTPSTSLPQFRLPPSCVHFALRCSYSCQVAVTSRPACHQLLQGRYLSSQFTGISFPLASWVEKFLFFSDCAWPDFVNLLHYGLEANEIFIFIIKNIWNTLSLS